MISDEYFQEHLIRKQRCRKYYNSLSPYKYLKSTGHKSALYVSDIWKDNINLDDIWKEVRCPNEIY